MFGAQTHQLVYDLLGTVTWWIENHHFTGNDITQPLTEVSCMDVQV